MLSVICAECREQAHYAECYYAECRYAERRRAQNIYIKAEFESLSLPHQTPVETLKSLQPTDGQTLADRTNPGSSIQL